MVVVETDVEEYKLMIPGPVELKPKVREQMAKPMVAHYGKNWTSIYKETIDLIKDIFKTKKGNVFLIPGTGSAGLDAAIGSIVGTKGKILVLNNGWFGDRLYSITDTHTNHLRNLKFQWGKAVKISEVEEVLANDANIDTMVAAHCDTSTGVLNPIRELSVLSDKYDVNLIVDAVSSLGGVEFNFDDWNIDIAVTASQKALEAPPGLAIVVINPSAWSEIERANNNGWYLNLKTWRKFAKKWSDWAPYPTTMAVSNVLALREGAKGVLQEGLEERFLRHRKVTNFLRRGLKNIGFELFASDEISSPTVTSVKIGNRISTTKLKKYLKERWQTRIAGMPGKLKGKVFRIGHIGPAAKLRRIASLLFGIEEALRNEGCSVEAGESLIRLNQLLEQE